MEEYRNILRNKISFNSHGERGGEEAQQAWHVEWATCDPPEVDNPYYAAIIVLRGF